MRRSFQVIVIVLLISFSGFLISRSCDDHGGRNNPADRGGEAKLIAVPDVQKPAELVASASPTPQPEEQNRSVEAQVKRSPRPASHEESRTVAAARPRTEATPEPSATATPQTNASGADDIAEYRVSPRARSMRIYRPRTAVAADERIQGTWVLTDERNTKLELTIINNRGFLIATVAQAGAPMTIQQEVTLGDSDANTVYVNGEEEPDTSRDLIAPIRPQRIVLAFQFNADGTPQLVLLRMGSIQTPLKIVSHRK